MIHSFAMLAKSSKIWFHSLEITSFTLYYDFFFLNAQSFFFFFKVKSSAVSLPPLDLNVIVYLSQLSVWGATCPLCFSFGKHAYLDSEPDGAVNVNQIGRSADRWRCEKGFTVYTPGTHQWQPVYYSGEWAEVGGSYELQMYWLACYANSMMY